jgi:hypothetical protein
MDENQQIHDRLFKNEEGNTVSADYESLRLIRPIYNAAEDLALWPDVLAQIGLALASFSEAFTIDDPGHGQTI